MWMAVPPFVQLGAPLPPADAAYLEEELRSRGIECHALGEEGELARVLVREDHLAESLRLAEELLRDEPEEPTPPALARRSKAWLGAGITFAGTLYLLKTVSRAAGGLVAFCAAAAVFLAVAYGGDDGPDGAAPEPPAGEDRRAS